MKSLIQLIQQPYIEIQNHTYTIGDKFRLKINETVAYSYTIVNILSDTHIDYSFSNGNILTNQDTKEFLPIVPVK